MGFRACALRAHHALKGRRAAVNGCRRPHIVRLAAFRLPQTVCRPDSQRFDRLRNSAIKAPLATIASAHPSRNEEPASSATVV